SMAMSLASTCRRWSITCTPAPTQMVTRKAMMRTGTARRRSGSAVKSRRYAGLAIDCARPLIESDCADALANVARAIDGLRSEFPHHPGPEGCAASLRITGRLESMAADLSRVRESIL